MKDQRLYTEIITGSTVVSKSLGADAGGDYGLGRVPDPQILFKEDI